MKALIPFVGFYESAHDADLDDAAQEMNVVDRDAVDWRIVFQNYAKAYAEAFLDFVKVPGTFVDMKSPREYNFSTDTIAVDIEEAAMQAAFDRAVERGLDELIEQEMRERSGFIPFFSQDLDEWGPVATWNEAQCELVLRVLAAEETTNGEWEQQDEIDLMEPARSNGKFEGWLYSSLPKEDGPMQKVFDVNLRLVYEGDVPAEQVSAAVELAVRDHLDKGFLNNAGWMNDPELEHARCISATLAKPEVVIDMTDVFSMQFSASLPMEVVTISRDPHDVEEVDPSATYTEVLSGGGMRMVSEWPGTPPEPAGVQALCCEVDPAVALFFENLRKG